ncbi:putative protein kinase RLK-Pelle-LRR-XII-1 family [Rosa chinensis]|uniref:Protein kinase domain-containing protein n=1 Tax=Rosa chinensis TaxID=74649 RepID=A0A2P6QHC5_ROSCH|nr:putative protein kinase RLK-Pelle-LRR-XII-1 family [Rosa chinensis]
MLANLRHRNLIKVISCCSQIDFKDVVLNYMPNGSLEKCLYSHNFCLNILQRLNILIDVVSALEYLHYGYERPIVHCDLKPSNMLLDDDMGAHVADFGIAKLLGGGESMTQTMTLATIGYMAPGLECISSIMRLALACCAESPEERINMQEALAILDKIKIKFLMDPAGGVVMNHHLVWQPVD